MNTVSPQVPGPTFKGSSLAESEPLQAAVCFSQTEEDAVRVLSGSTEQQRGRRQLRVTLILYTHWHLHLSLRGAVGRGGGKEVNGRTRSSGCYISAMNIFMTFISLKNMT